MQLRFSSFAVAGSSGGHEARQSVNAAQSALFEHVWDWVWHCPSCCEHVVQSLKGSVSWSTQGSWLHGYGPVDELGPAPYVEETLKLDVDDTTLFEAIFDEEDEGAEDEDFVAPEPPAPSTISISFAQPAPSAPTPTASPRSIAPAVCAMWPRPSNTRIASQ